jgi:hypothetical protein
MKPLRIKHVAQKHDKGCVVACIAMVLGWDYDKVVAEFHNDFNKKGISGDIAKDFICDYGFSVIEKRGGGYIDLDEHNKRMMTPFAPVHIVTVKQFIDAKINHCVVMNSKGKIYDPSDKSRDKVFYYSVEHVMGFFKT